MHFHEALDELGISKDAPADEVQSAYLQRLESLGSDRQALLRLYKAYRKVRNGRSEEMDGGEILAFPGIPERGLLAFQAFLERELGELPDGFPPQLLAIASRLLRTADSGEASRRARRFADQHPEEARGALRALRQLPLLGNLLGPSLDDPQEPNP